MKKAVLVVLLGLALVILVGITQPSSAFAEDYYGSAAISARMDDLYNRLGGPGFFTVNRGSCTSSFERSHSCSNCFNENVLNAAWFRDIFGTISYSSFPTSYRNSSEYTQRGWSCLGFAHFAEYWLYRDPNNPSAKVSTQRIGTYTFNYDNATAYAHTGDVIGFDTSHSAICYYSDGSGMYVLDSNWGINGQQCRVDKHYIPYSRYTNFTISRATNAGSQDPVIVDERHLYYRQLKSGDNGNDVRELQQYLIDLGYDMGSYGADGNFGATTKARVMDFQRDNGLEVDGIFGQSSYNKLMEALHPPTPSGCDEYYNIIADDGFLNMRSTPNGTGINGQAYTSDNPLHITQKQNDANGNPWGWTTSASCPGGGWVALYSPFAVQTDAPISNLIDMSQSFNGYIIANVPWKHLVMNRNTLNLELESDSSERLTAWGTWHFERQGDGSYVISNLYNGMVLDVYGAGTSNGTNVTVHEWNGGDNQYWYLTGNGWCMVPKCAPRMCLDVNPFDNGTNVKIWERNGTDCQKIWPYNIDNDTTDEFPTSMTIDSNATVKVGEAVNIGYRFTPENVIWDYKGIIWQSSDPAVATVDNAGKVIGVKPGSVTITATSTYNDHFVSICTVEVTGKEMSSGYDRILPDGNYFIVNAEDPSFYLDIEGRDVPAPHGTNVSLYKADRFDDLDRDAWTIKYIDGFYRISQMNTNMCLDMKNGSVLRGGNVVVANNNDSSAQRWAVSLNNTGSYRIQSKCSGMSLDIYGGTLDIGTNIQQWTGHEDGAAQRWLFIPYKPAQTLAAGRYILVSAIDDAYELDVSGDGYEYENERNIQIWNHNESRFYEQSLSQYNSFDVVPLDNGYYKLVHVASGKEMTSLGGGTGLGQNIAIYDANGHVAHEWAITPDGDNGNYVLWAGCSGLVMDVDSGIAEDGRNARQWLYNGTKAQTWKFVPAEYAVHYDANGGSSAPDDQIRYYKGKLTLSAQKPTRDGYAFVGWATTRTARTAEYQPGDTYDRDAALTLYALWEKQIRLVLPAALKEIGEEAFVNCGASIIVIPDGCEEIGARAFADCAKLTDITIPASVLTISRTAFSDCSSALTIHGEVGSVAASFAKARGFQFVEISE